jgi:hypothetical protein
MVFVEKEVVGGGLGSFDASLILVQNRLSSCDFDWVSVLSLTTG